MEQWMASRSVYKYRLHCLTEGQHVQGWATETPTTCFTSSAHTIDPASVVVVDEVSDARALVSARRPDGGSGDVTAQQLAGHLNALHVSVVDPLTASGEVLVNIS